MSDDATQAEAVELPERVVERAERLTRLAREAVDGDEATAYREDRAETLASHDFTARVREDDTGDVLVLHPDEWVKDGSIHPERIDDTDRAVEVRLSGPGEPDEWDDLDEHNRELVAAVRESHGDVHGDNAAAFADFMGNHYAKPVEAATAGEIREFLEDYFVRNVWPSAAQKDVVEDSIRHVFDAAGERVPGF